MSGSSDDSGEDGPRSPADMVSTMPVAIAELRERLARLDSQLTGVDTNLERMAGADPNATEEIRMTPSQRARIDAAASGIEDTDTNIPVVSHHAQALAEVDAVLGEFDPPPTLPDLETPSEPDSAIDGAGFGRRPTMPEMPVSPPAPSTGAPSEQGPPTGGAAQEGAAQGGGMRWLAALVVLGGAGYFIWQATTTVPSPQTKVAVTAAAPAATSTTSQAPAAAPAPKSATPKGPAAAPAPKSATPKAPAAAPTPAAQKQSAEPVNLAPMIVPPQDGEGAPAAAAAQGGAEPSEAPSVDVALNQVDSAKAVDAEAAPTPKSNGAVEALSGEAVKAAASTAKAKAVDGAPATPEAALKEPEVPAAPLKRPVTSLPAGELIDAMEAIRADPAPKEIVRGIHYFISNEAKHYLWRDDVSGLGGIMVGVGAEQNYLIAGWARPELLVLMDFDIYIPWLHKAYRVAFDLASTPDELITLWRDKEGRERLKAGIVRTYGETGEVQDILRAVKYAKAVGRHLAKLQARYAGMGVPCFLTDQAQYDFLAGLWRDGRVLAIRGDLTGKRTMVDLAAFSRISELPVRLVYMSNAEFYFRFNKGRFRDNMVGLPFDSRSLILRTDPHSGSKYRFYKQRGEDFVAWLERGKASSVAAMGKYRTRRDDVDDFVLDKLPEQVGKAR